MTLIYNCTEQQNFQTVDVRLCNFLLQIFLAEISLQWNILQSLSPRIKSRQRKESTIDIYMSQSDIQGCKSNNTDNLDEVSTKCGKKYTMVNKAKY